MMMKMAWCADNVLRTRVWVMTMVLMAVGQVMTLSGPHVCMVEQKYNITKRVKYRAPMSIRTYEWCLAMPPRCSRWRTEMRDVTRLESEERTTEVAVCCPGYKMRDVSCVPICPNGKTGHGCTLDCPLNKWGPNCAHECSPCVNGRCSVVDGDCLCHDGWEGESCQIGMTSTISTTTVDFDIDTVPNHTIENVYFSPSKEKTTEKFSIKVIAPELTTAVPTTTISTAALPRITTVKDATSTERTIISHSDSTISTSVIPTFTNTTRLQPVEQSTYVNMPSSVLESHPTSLTNTTTIVTKNTTVANVKVYPKQTTLYSTVKKIETTTLKPAITTTDVYKITWKPEKTVKPLPTTIKFNPKEIWIKPAQKGDSQIIESKIKPSYEMPIIRHLKNSTKKDVLIPSTTPRTIIVSIIPTSLSYSTFKKISFTTAPSLTNQQQSKKNNLGYVPRINLRSNSTSTSIPYTVKYVYSVAPIKQNVSSTVNSLAPRTTKSLLYHDTNKTLLAETTSVYVSNNTNSTHSMTNEVNKTSPSYLSTDIPVFSNKILLKRNASKMSTSKDVVTTPVTEKTSFHLQQNSMITIETTLKHNNLNEKATERTVTKDTIKDYVSKYSPIKLPIREKKTTNVASKSQILTTVNVKPVYTKNDVDSTTMTNTITKAGATAEDDTFHVLTEPEHITAVIADKGTKSSTLDLISVFSIAVGVMMSMITVAIIIVMIDRCKKSKYDEVKKSDNLRLKEMDNHSTSPQYIRSIFHTPLPDPPEEKTCHYQPISTLDRNLKQFMRPVVVQTLSPLMIENFRGILECHYDHLPQRSSRCETRCSVAPSTDNSSELLYSESTTDSDIEALKCEAKEETIDITNSEPLYAEIPCWRPVVEHAVEITNRNSEAVTEL